MPVMFDRDQLVQILESSKKITERMLESIEGEVGDVQLAYLNGAKDTYARIIRVLTAEEEK